MWLKPSFPASWNQLNNKNDVDFIDKNKLDIISALKLNYNFTFDENVYIIHDSEKEW